MSLRLIIVLCFAMHVGYPSAIFAQYKTDAHAMTPCYLTANDLSIATGQPSVVTMSNGAGQIPVWSLSGATIGQSVVGLVPQLPQNCDAVKIEIVVITDSESNSKYEDVYRVHLSQSAQGPACPSRNIVGTPVRTALPDIRFQTRTIVLESYCSIDSGAPLSVRIQREPGDKADTFPHPTGLVMVKITPLSAPAKAYLVQDTPGYNSWPMLQAIGNKLVCVYSRGSAHSIAEDARAVYARTSSDGGKTWTPETIVANTPHYGEVEIGKGLDSTGAMLLWVRRIGAEWNHDLYRSTDGVHFTLLSKPKLDVMPVQITDVFAVPTVGLMALWFAGSYGDDGPSHSWGTLTSSDDGATWKQHVIESNLTKENWPTEQAAVCLGKGKILAIARTEMGGMTTQRCQFQLISTDYGKTWKREQTNIGDVVASTPSLVFDCNTGLLSNYYYHRGRGVVRCRVVKPDVVFEHPLNWPEATAVATGSDVTFDAGNSNATAIDGTHYISFYSGKGKNTSVYVVATPAKSSK
ncbi:MAG: sialidase family protein [Thermoguttaceae bacterium]|nr:sialidase family protein [Thermoguttaceae bacterium]